LSHFALAISRIGSPIFSLDGVLLLHFP
jgi:hypothetical protein